ncbi:hypothetical protein NUW58_g3735 [Xylaria curta]|uniref:Uncharacterized protein n=1 Tax=Xylaria curta TaxID=42375 RepID=A0ACC1PC74_9PEZI|nr:hypothetical protein NUW58_g3735 [Xylaria curta]
MPDLLHIRTPEEMARPAGRSQAGQVAGIGQKRYQTGIFYFSQQRLRALKDAVNVHVASREPGSWVSTSNILSSLLWSAIIEAEGHAPLHVDKSATDDDTRMSTLSFPVQFRSVFRPPLPRDFLGAAFVMTNARVLHKDVCLISHPGANSESVAQDQEPNPESWKETETETETSVYSINIPALAKVALAIRKSTQRIDDTAVRQVLAYLEAHPEVNQDAPLVLGPPRYDSGGSGTSVVSWADQQVYELNWGAAIGHCNAVRLLKMGYDRDPIVLPRLPNLNGDGGGLEVIMSYEENAMRRLVEGSVMRRFAVLRCLS